MTAKVYYEKYQLYIYISCSNDIKVSDWRELAFFNCKSKVISSCVFRFGKTHATFSTNYKKENQNQSCLAGTRFPAALVNLFASSCD